MYTFYSLLLILVRLQNASAGQECVSVFLPNFKSCDLDNTESIPAKAKCQSNIPQCKRGFNVSTIQLEPFSDGKFMQVINEIIPHCCGNCGNVRVINKFASMKEITSVSINSSDLIYPILGNVNTLKLYGYHFVPFWNVPKAFYLTKKRTKFQQMQFLFISIFNLWPLIVSMLLMSLFAGSIIWAIDTWVNKEEFSRKFVTGIFDGFWWAFITMTTVGYGDKSPKVFLARIVSVIWILMGITICALFTACLTTDITKAVSPQNTEVNGKRIGVLKERVFDFSFVAKLGGQVQESQHKKLIPSVTEFIDKIQNETIDGFFLDIFSYRVIIKSFEQYSSLKKYADFLANSALIRTKKYEGVELSYGMLLKNYDDYTFLNSFVTDNRVGIEACDNNAYNQFHKYLDSTANEKPHDLFSTESGLFEMAMIAIGSLLAFTIVFGIIYEFCRYRRKKKNEVGEESEVRIAPIFSGIFTTNKNNDGNNNNNNNGSGYDVFTVRQ